MVELTESAKKELDAYFDGKEKGTIRIYLMGGGCSGPMLVLALDTPDEEDIIEEADGYKFCIKKKLAEDVGNIKVDAGDHGFMLTAQNPLPQPEGGGCGGCCGGCGGN